MANATEAINAVDMLQDAAAEYSRDVILKRALPDLRDGMKPVQRRIMWQAHLSKLTSTAKPQSVATLVGATMKWHPHGDGSIESALTNMSRTWIINAPLIQIIGNGGSLNAGPAAGRYIRARKTRFADLMTSGLDKNAVDMEPNYDNSAEEPAVLPAAVPVALTLGSQGIAWGVDTSIAQHNPIEMLNAAIALVEDPNISIDDLVKIVPGPDFQMRGVIVGREGGYDDMLKGEARYIIRGRHRITTHEDYKRQKILEIYELPNGLNDEALTQQIAKVLTPYANRFKIQSIDNTSRMSEDTGEYKVSILIACSDSVPDSEIEQIAALLYSKTPLQSSRRTLNRMIHNDRSQVLGIRDYLVAWLEFRKETLARIMNRELDEYNKEREILEATMFVIENAKKISEIAISSTSKQNMIDTLTSTFDVLNERQATHISGQAIYRLSNKDPEHIESTQKKLDNVVSKIESHETYLSTSENMDKMLIKDLKSSIDFLGPENFPRMTEIIDAEEAPKMKAKVEEAAIVESKPVVVVVRNDLTAIRIGERAFQNQFDANADRIRDYIATTTDSYVMMITRSGQAVTRLVNDLPHVNLDENVEPMNREVVSLERNDDFIAVVVIGDDSRIMTFSKRGYVKAITTSKIAPSTRTRGYLKKTVKVSGLKGGDDELTHVLKVTDEFKDATFIKYTVQMPKRDATHELLLSKWLNRDDTGGSSGARGLKLKDGEYVLKSFELA